MKVSMLTFSQTGNTLKVGRRIANALLSRQLEVDHVRFLERKRWRPENADAIGIGCPCFESRPAELVPRFLDGSGLDLTGKLAFVYITSSSSPAKTLWRLSQAVERTGATVVGGVQVTGVSTAPSMFGLTPKRPDPQDLSRVDAFGRSLAERLIAAAPMPVEFRIDPKRGSRFYDRVGWLANHIKKLTISPPGIDHTKCTLCGNCVRECPEDNITIRLTKIEVGEHCCVCWRCWHVCPSEALSMKLTPGMNGLVEHALWSETLERFFGELAPDQERGTNLYRDAFARRVRLRYDRHEPTAEYDFVDVATKT